MEDHLDTLRNFLVAPSSKERREQLCVSVVAPQSTVDKLKVQWHPHVSRSARFDGVVALAAYMLASNVRRLDLLHIRRVLKYSLALVVPVGMAEIAMQAGGQMVKDKLLLSS